jgi:hypothetical protein
MATIRAALMRAPTHILGMDETGDHVMQYAGRPQPAPADIFLLCACLFEVKAYTDFAERLKALKQHYLGRTDLSLVSSQIRRREGVFSFLSGEDRRCQFQEAIAAMIRETDFLIFAAAIDKNRLWSRYKDNAYSPYDLSLAFIMKRVATHLSGAGARVRTIAECRGPRPDNDLRLEFARLLRMGTRWVSAERMQDCFAFPLMCRPKKDNVPALQMADLVAYPLAHRLRFPDARRKDFVLLEGKLHRAGKRTWGAGLKVFPDANASDYGL